MRKLLVIFSVSFVLFCGTCSYRVVKSIQFDRNCSGYLERAANANTVLLAQQQLEVAVNYLEQNGLTNGYTSVLYRTPDEDIGFWYQNLKASLEGLKRVNPEASQLEESNVLMKLRETLMDDTKDGQSITHPPGISVYPHNAIVGILMWVWFLGMVGTMCVLLYPIERSRF